MRQRQDVFGQRELHRLERAAACISAWGTQSIPGSLEIHWPSGKKETVKLPAIDRMYTITEGTGITGELCGGRNARKVGPARTSGSAGRP